MTWLHAVSPRRRTVRGRPQHGRSRQASADGSFTAPCAGSVSQGELASVGHKFESALFDSSCR